MPIATKKPAGRRPEILPVLLLFAVLALLFWRSFLPGYVHFSNDGPLGAQSVDYSKFPASLFGSWNDLLDTGFNGGSASPSISSALKGLLGPVGYSKFLAPAALFLLGLGAWAFFRTLKFSPLAATLGALAAILNSTFLGTACWGVASQQIALGMDFFALALVMSNHRETPAGIRWARLALAGFCVGMNVMEAADIGALLSLIIAAFIFFKSLTEDWPVVKRIIHGGSRVALVAVCAGFIALQTMVSLFGVAIQGVAGAAQDTDTKAHQWDFCTQWSLPKKETLTLIIPGLFGYKMDTPNNMMPQFQDAYRSGLYWGGVGRDPVNDRFFDSGGQGSPPNPSWMRFTSGVNYCGILVALIAAWTVAQSFRRQNSPFTGEQKKLIWFWTAVLAASLLLAWGRFAPVFYGLLYALPYFSTIRNPTKFLIFLSWAMVILFAYGIHALNRRHLDSTAPKASGLATQLKSWWAKASNFDRKWTYATVGLFVASVLGWLIYSSEQTSLVHYLQTVGFPDTDPANENSAPAIAAFSLRQAAWWLLLFAAAIGLVTAVIAGYFNGPRARLGAVLLGAFLVFDLGRADLPYIIHWDYKQKYEVGALNPIVDFLRNKTYEHRVAGLPFEAKQQLRLYDNAFGGMGIYRIEWTQHLFLYYNIQCLDVIQMPRLPEDMQAYFGALEWQSSPERLPLLARHWELTNTRYLLGPAGFLDVMNQQLDPVQHRFRIAQRFDIIPKPGIAHPTQLEELTATASPDGDLALFDFTGALPRAKLYGNWQVNTNDQANLKMLGDLNFHPSKTVLVSTPQKNLPAVAAGENSGSVEFQSYHTKDIVLAATNTGPAVLLLNDKFDPQWRVAVDGKPAQLLRCNFMMRGVYLPAAGAHKVEFSFSVPSKPLDATLTALGIAVLLCGFLFFAGRRSPATPA